MKGPLPQLAELLEEQVAQKPTFQSRIREREEGSFLDTVFKISMAWMAFDGLRMRLPRWVPFSMKRKMEERDASEAQRLFIKADVVEIVAGSLLMKDVVGGELSKATRDINETIGSFGDSVVSLMDRFSRFAVERIRNGSGDIDVVVRDLSRELDETLKEVIRSDREREAVVMEFQKSVFEGMEKELREQTRTTDDLVQMIRDDMKERWFWERRKEREREIRENRSVFGRVKGVVGGLVERSMDRKAASGIAGAVSGVLGNGVVSGLISGASGVLGGLAVGGLKRGAGALLRGAKAAPGLLGRGALGVAGAVGKTALRGLPAIGIPLALASTLMWNNTRENNDFISDWLIHGFNDKKAVEEGGLKSAAATAITWAGMGSALGSILPGVGTLAGGVAGALAGGVAGFLGAGWFRDFFSSDDPKEASKKVAEEISERISRVREETKKKISEKVMELQGIDGVREVVDGVSEKAREIMSSTVELKTAEVKLVSAAAMPSVSPVVVNNNRVENNSSMVSLKTRARFDDPSLLLRAQMLKGIR